MSRVIARGESKYRNSILQSLIYTYCFIKDISSDIILYNQGSFENLLQRLEKYHFCNDFLLFTCLKPFICPLNISLKTQDCHLVVSAGKIRFLV